MKTSVSAVILILICVALTPVIAIIRNNEALQFTVVGIQIALLLLTAWTVLRHKDSQEPYPDIDEPAKRPPGEEPSTKRQP